MAECVSSAYSYSLHRPGTMVASYCGTYGRSAALTMYETGPIADTCLILAVIFRTAHIGPLYLVQCGTVD